MALLVTNQRNVIAQEIEEVESIVNQIDLRGYKGHVMLPIRQEGASKPKRLFDERAVMHVVTECNELGFFCYYYRPLNCQAPTHIMISRVPDDTEQTKRIMN